MLHVRWREKATPYNSQPSRLQYNRHVYNSHRHVYKTAVTPTIHTVTSTKQPSRLQFTAVTSTKQLSRQQNSRHTYNSRRHAYKTTVTPTVHSHHVYNSQLVL